MARAIAALLLALALAPATAPPAAAITVEAYQKWRLSNRTFRATPTGVMEIRLLGVFRGLLLANRVVKRRGDKPFICPPDAVEITARQLRGWVDAELKAPSLKDGKPYHAETPVDFIVLVVATRKWPCPEPKK